RRRSWAPPSRIRCRSCVTKYPPRSRKTARRSPVGATSTPKTSRSQRRSIPSARASSAKLGDFGRQGLPAAAGLGVEQGGLGLVDARGAVQRTQGAEQRQRLVA